MVYRPMAVEERRIKEYVKYCDIKFERPRTTLGELRYKIKRNCRQTYFDTISYKNFFYEYNWDVVKTRKLHKFTAIKHSKNFKKRWLDSRDCPTHSQYRRKMQNCANEICNFLMYKMFDEMCENDNKLYFPVNWKGKTEGWYKIGVFREKMDLKLKERLILAILPHERERITKYYPVLFSSPVTNEKLKLAETKSNTYHEDINVSERIAENNRLSGFCRRVRQLAPH